ncbi:MAG: cytochrome c [Gammaproteobacteria bacterium]|nr:cytochrome c [Gammaproteobacteria bacterium]MCY4227108.1 cytochrome c [Gammaproteobacteria bacterium]
MSSADDIQAGRLKAEVACQTCHGIDGLATIAMVPNLSGQREDYTIIQLEAYRSGKRQHSQMSIIAQSLSDEDIRNLAAWYAAIEIAVTVPDE